MSALSGSFCPQWSRWGGRGMSGGDSSMAYPVTWGSFPTPNTQCPVMRWWQGISPTAAWLAFFQGSWGACSFIQSSLCPCSEPGWY